MHSQSFVRWNHIGCNIDIFTTFIPRSLSTNWKPKFTWKHIKMRLQLLGLCLHSAFLFHSYVIGFIFSHLYVWIFHVKKIINLNHRWDINSCQISLENIYSIFFAIFSNQSIIECNSERNNPLFLNWITNK